MCSDMEMKVWSELYLSGRLSGSGIVHIKYSLVLIGEWPMQWTTGVIKVVVCVILSGG